MGDILLDEQGAPTAPSAGQVVLFGDNTAPTFGIRDANRIWTPWQHNWSTASQGPGFAADTWLTGSDLLIPSFGLQVGSLLEWQISASKTNASTAAPAYTVRTGSGRSTSDTSRVVLTGPVQTAVVDIGVLHIYALVRSTGAAGVIQATAIWDHQAGTAVGFGGGVEATGAGFDMTGLAGQYISLSINGGSSSAWTVTQVRSLAKW